MSPQLHMKRNSKGYFMQLLSLLLSSERLLQVTWYFRFILTVQHTLQCKCETKQTRDDK